MPRQNSHSNSPEPKIEVGDYILEHVIGQGTYGKVRIGTCKTTNEKVY
jgi:hypothetical protein